MPAPSASQHSSAQGMPYAAPPGGAGMLALQMPLLMQLPGAGGPMQVQLHMGPGGVNAAPMWQQPNEQEEEPLFMSREERRRREQQELRHVSEPLHLRCRRVECMLCQ